MEAFREYLQRKNFKQRTVNEIVKTVQIFKAWEQAVKTSEVTYQDVMKYLSMKDITMESKMNIVNHLRKYFAFQIEIGERNDNPAMDIQIKTNPRSIVKTFAAMEMDEVFGVYRKRHLREITQRETHLKYLTLLGLIIYQGLNVKELEVLQVTDVDLNGGLVTIPSTERTNARKLRLDSRQIIPMMDHMKNCKGRLIEDAMKGNIATITGHLKQLGYRKITVKQLKESRIVLWLREHNIRQVQYLSGFKYISSLEKYRSLDIEGLKEKVGRFHPLGEL